MSTPPNPKNETPEKIILNQCKAVLRMLKNQGKLTFTRIHVMPVIRTDYRGKHKYTPNSDMIGFSDLEILANGIIGYVEVKTETNTLSTLQREFLLDRQRHGAKIAVVRSADELAEFLKKEMSIDVGFEFTQSGGASRHGSFCRLSNDKRGVQIHALAC